MSHNTSYQSAAGAYGATATTDGNQRVLEGKLLLQAATKLEMLARRLAAKETVSLEEIGDVIDYNRKLWTVFVGDTMDPEHPLPQEIKSNIANLGIYVFKRSIEFLSDSTADKLTILININRNIAAGLMKQPAGEKAAAAPSPEAGERSRLKEDSFA
jgi:flagellar protein FlaF